MVDLKNCSQCGRLFGNDGKNDLCKKCRSEEDNEFKKVKEYLWENPNSTVNEVHEDTGVKKELILKFINEGRLEAEGLNIGDESACERCGKSISRGKYCYKCQQTILDGIKDNMKQKKEKKDKGKGMFIKNRINKKKD